MKVDFMVPGKWSENEKRNGSLTVEGVELSHDLELASSLPRVREHLAFPIIYLMIMHVE
jgi:hypothetical protein